MHSIPSIATKIAQMAKADKTKKILLCCGVFCAIFVCSFAFREAVYRVTAANWEAGWSAWKSGDSDAALEAWSRGAWAQPFAIRPARLCYWKICALEKLGRRDEASAIASLLAACAPLDFYSFVLAYEGKYPKLTRAVDEAKARAHAPRLWEEEISAASSRTGVRENIVFAVMKRESKFKADAVSARGAIGLMQLMPQTARETAGILKDETLSPYEPRDNILLGAAYFSRLLAKFRRRLPLAVAAYNAGAATVSKWGAEASDWVEWLEDVPYPQTREYLRSVLENIEIYDYGGAAQRQGRGSFFAWARFSPSFTTELAEKVENSTQME